MVSSRILYLTELLCTCLYSYPPIAGIILRADLKSSCDTEATTTTICHLPSATHELVSSREYNQPLACCSWECSLTAQGLRLSLEYDLSIILYVIAGLLQKYVKDRLLSVRFWQVAEKLVSKGIRLGIILFQAGLVMPRGPPTCSP